MPFKQLQQLIDVATVTLNNSISEKDPEHASLLAQQAQATALIAIAQALENQRAVPVFVKLQQ